MGPIFTPPVVSSIDGPLGTLMAPATGGGTNWPGGAYDPENNMVYVVSNSSVTSLAVVPPYPGQSDMAYIQGSALSGPRTSGGAGSSAGGGRTEFDAAQRAGCPGFSSLATVRDACELPRQRSFVLAAA